MSRKKSSFLLAMPSMKDPLFMKSVVLLTSNNEEGALGFILNVTTGAELKEALNLMEYKIKNPPELPILLGGPVQTEFFWMIHSPVKVYPTTISKDENFAISGAMEIFPDIGKAGCPEIYFAGVGYAGWGASQLEEEIEEGSWWLDCIDPDDIFSVSPQNKWHEAFKILGIETAEIVDKTDTNEPPIIN
ncbi:MAG: YqgE/AlgH family protein [SAR324 cluster bacterium]|nr:YqgE/AlgH family protein [SAR324 cluster bacterium]